MSSDNRHPEVSAVDILSQLVRSADPSLRRQISSVIDRASTRQNVPTVVDCGSAQVPPPPPPPPDEQSQPRSPREQQQAKRQRLVANDPPQQPPPAAAVQPYRLDRGYLDSPDTDSDNQRLTNDSGSADLWEQVLEQQRLLLQHQHQQVQRLQQRQSMSQHMQHLQQSFNQYHVNVLQREIPTVHAQAQLENSPAVQAQLENSPAVQVSVVAPLQDRPAAVAEGVRNWPK